MLTFLLVVVLSLAGAIASLIAIWLGWVVVGTISDIRKARELRARKRAVWDAIGKGDVPPWQRDEQ